jgi:FkbM family methyltransferase
VSVNPADLAGPYATVFDVGAFQGDFAKACLHEWPDTVVHSFEPLLGPPPEVGAPRWYWHGVALGRLPGVTTMYRCTFLPSSSILPMLELHETAFPYTKGSEPVEVQVETLAAYAGEGIVTLPALLKIDVQGYELQVLRGAADYLELFDAVVLEVSHEPLYDGAPTPEQLAGHLHAQGYTLHSVVDRMTHPKQPRWLLQSDELWVRA